MRRIGFATLFAFTLAATQAADKTETHMTTPGKVLVDASFAKGLGEAWKVGKGKYEPADGAIRVAEIPADMHGAVARHDVKFTDGIISFSFKLDGAKTISLSLNGAKGHISRVQIRPTGFSVNKDDQDGKNGPDKGELLGKKDVKIETGKWHTMVLELRGEEMLACLDGQHFAYGKHTAVAKEKSNIGLTCAGEFASFKNLKLTEATANSDWAKTKEKLLKP